MDDIWYAFLETLVVAIVPTLVAVGIGYLLRAVSDLWESFRFSRPDQARALEWAAAAAVKAAEQAGLAGYVTDKKFFALKHAQDLLRMKGVKIDLNVISAAIEAAVYDEFTKFKTEQLEVPDTRLDNAIGDGNE